MNASRPAPGRALHVWHVNIGNHAGPVDGVGTVSAQLARDQAALGHRARLVVAADPAHHDAIRRAAGDGVRTVLSAGPAMALAGAWAALDSPTSRPDVVHLHSVFRPAHRLLAARARRAGVPVVLSPHAGLAPLLLRRDGARKALYGRLIERRFHRIADGVHALQLLEREDVLRYCAAVRPVEVVPNPVGPALLAAPPWDGGERPDRERALAVLLCRYDVYQKGLDRLVAIARRLPDLDIRVHGTADKNDPEKAAAVAASAPPNLRFAAPVHGEAKLALLREADLFLMPSRVEGLSASLVEAMALGVPCAVSSYVGRSLGMGEQGTALVLDDDPATAARQVAALLRDRPRAVALGRAARAHARRAFPSAAVAAAHIDHYHRLLAGPPRRSSPGTTPLRRAARPGRRLRGGGP